MSPQTREADVEKKVPITKSQGYVALHGRKVPDVTDLADHPVVYWELSTGMAERHKKGRKSIPQVSRIRLDIFGTEEPSFPRLLSKEERLALSRFEFLEEIELITEMQGLLRYEGTHIYSIRVTSPRDFRFDTKQDLPYGRQHELSMGYIQHDILYNLSPEARSHLLSLLAERADSVEVVVRGGQQETRRKTVDLANERVRVVR